MKINITTNKEKQTRIRKPNPNVNSYITTIPAELIKLLDLSENDNILWKYEIKNNELKLEVEFKKQ